MSEFFRFPHTPHLAWLGTGQPRDDKVLSTKDVEELLNGEVLVEEKLDGANLGLSLDDADQIRIQNRGQYLESPYQGQFSRLSSWLGMHEVPLRNTLTPNLILFGEWCAARHSLDYSELPDWFLGFDVYDRTTDRFWSSNRRNDLFESLGIPIVPECFKRHTNLNDLTELLVQRPSAFRKGPMEGIIVRSESENWLTARAKLVRSDFTQSIDEHWSKRRIEWNQLS